LIQKIILGVPYAKKPLGVRRFAVPEMIEPWEGEFKVSLRQFCSDHSLVVI
jgi:carboxylesterase type B